MEKTFKRSMKGTNGPFLLAVSGGLDSVCLLHSAAQVLPKEALTVAHFNHRTRGKESDGDEAFVRELAERYGLPFVVAQREGKGISEASLRTERMKFLKLAAKTHGAQILLAHHLDDRVETFLFRLVRGSQLKGLTALKQRNGRLLRPFVSLPKEALKRYAQKEKLVFREDSTNAKDLYFRNRIRKELVPPLLKLTASYGGPEKFYERFSDLLKESEILLSRQDRAYDRALKPCLIRTPYFDRVEMNVLPLEFQNDRAFIRRLFEKIHYKAFDKKAVRKVCRLIKEKRGGCSLPGKMAVEISCGHLYFQDSKQKKLWEKGPDFSQLKLTGTKQEYCVRSFVLGDRYKKKKLKRKFLKIGVPRLERRLIPLVLCEKSKEVVWFVGLPEVNISYSGWNFPHAHLSRFKSSNAL